MIVLFSLNRTIDAFNANGDLNDLVNGQAMPCQTNINGGGCTPPTLK